MTCHHRQRYKIPSFGNPLNLAPRRAYALRDLSTKTLAFHWASMSFLRELHFEPYTAIRVQRRWHFISRPFTFRESFSFRYFNSVRRESSTENSSIWNSSACWSVNVSLLEKAKHVKLKNWQKRIPRLVLYLCRAERLLPGHILPRGADRLLRFHQPSTNTN